MSLPYSPPLPPFSHGHQYWLHAFYGFLHPALHQATSRNVVVQMRPRGATLRAMTSMAMKLRPTGSHRATHQAPCLTQWIPRPIFYWKKLFKAFCDVSPQPPGLLAGVWQFKTDVKKHFCSSVCLTWPCPLITVPLKT